MNIRDGSSSGLPTGPIHDKGSTNIGLHIIMIIKKEHGVVVKNTESGVRLSLSFF